MQQRAAIETHDADMIEAQYARGSHDVDRSVDYRVWMSVALGLGDSAFAGDPHAKPKDVAAREQLALGNKHYHVLELEQAIETYNAFAERVSLRFVEAHRHVAIVGPVGVGLAQALGDIACRRGSQTE